jgi:hypothetical protein
MTDQRSKQSPPFKEFSGVVVMDRVSPGSKSERMAVQLDMGDKKLLLRRPGIRTYSDKTLEELVGRQITCSGLKRGNRLYLRDWALSEATDKKEKESS